MLSETENRTPRTEADAPNYRQWEVAGGSHLPRMAFDNFRAPIERDLGLTLSASCVDYLLTGTFVVNPSALRAPRNWANGRTGAPDEAPREYRDTPADPNNQLVRDELGIARGRNPDARDVAAGAGQHGINAADPAGRRAVLGVLLPARLNTDLPEQELSSRYDNWATLHRPTSRPRPTTSPTRGSSSTRTSSRG
ncbi:MAG: alpha/beta hydrolase domain-containing protein [Solirubrobacterales bacterium]